MKFTLNNPGMSRRRERRRPRFGCSGLRNGTQADNDVSLPDLRRATHRELAKEGRDGGNSMTGTSGSLKVASRSVEALITDAHNPA